MMVTFPALLFGLLVSALYGAAFHLWKNGGLGRLVVFLFFSVAGFWVGHLIGFLLKFNFLNIGPIYFGIATLSSFIFLMVGNELSKTK